MAKPYSDDLRLKMVGMVRSGVSRNWRIAQPDRESLSGQCELRDQADAAG